MGILAADRTNCAEEFCTWYYVRDVYFRLQRLPGLPLAALPGDMRSVRHLRSAHMCKHFGVLLLAVVESCTHCAASRSSVPHDRTQRKQPTSLPSPPHILLIYQSTPRANRVVNRSPTSPSLTHRWRRPSEAPVATHVAVCAATSGEPIITAAHTKELLAGEERTVKICSVSRPEAFSLEAILMVAQQAGRAQLRFDYGNSTLAPTREKVNRDGVKENVTWSSVAMASEACKQAMDEAVLKLLVS